MYRYVKATSRSHALQAIYKDLIRSGYRAEINKDHNCVDVFDEYGQVVEQQYPERLPDKERTREGFLYVGENQGDYIKVERSGTEKDYSSKSHLVKHVSKTERRIAPNNNQLDLGI